MGEAAPKLNQQDLQQPTQKDAELISLQSRQEQKLPPLPTEAELAMDQKVLQLEKQMAEQTEASNREYTRQYENWKTIADMAEDAQAELQKLIAESKRPDAADRVMEEVLKEDAAEEVEKNRAALEQTREQARNIAEAQAKSEEEYEFQESLAKLSPVERAAVEAARAKSEAAYKETEQEQQSA